MYLEIVSPEATLFGNKVESVSVPGTEGEFQMLNNHAAIVSVLQKGQVKFQVNAEDNINFDELHESIVVDAANNKVLTLAIKSGTVEMKDNKVIILAD
ncbi:F0F1 ATP synthase subunit epsilon [Flavobacteriaceae bacterium]|nr:F0F1 ATP synthase subunit epsilon [Flavobacteriaceae bacterium]